MSLPPLQSFRFFEAAARHLSFKLAATELHVTPAAVSHQIRQMEAHLGCALFVRLTRALELTEQGAAMLPLVQEGLAKLVEATATLRRSTMEARTFRIVVPPTFGTRWLMPRLQAFADHEPQVELSVGTSLSAIDAGTGANEGALDELLTGHIQAEVRAGLGHYPGLRCDRLFSVDYVPVCQPALLRGKRPLRVPNDLRYHALIHDDTIPHPESRPSWAAWLALAGAPEVDASRGLHFSNSGLALDAAADGLGIALAPLKLIGRDVAAGRLAVPFELVLPSRFDYWLVTREGQGEWPEVEALRDWMLGEIAASG